MSPGLARLSIPILAVLVFAALAAWFGARRLGWPLGVASVGTDTIAVPSRSDGGSGASPSGRGAGTDTAAATPPAVGATPGPMPAPAAAEPARTAALPAPGAGALAPASPAASAGVPSFDIVRVEPSGESVIAGRTVPGATVELLDNGAAFARVVADAAGQFAFVPPPLTSGSHDIAIRSTTPDGVRTLSGQSVAVLIAPDRKTAPLVTVTAPGQPSVVLSKPEEPAAGNGAVASAGPASGPPGAGAPAENAGARSAGAKSADVKSADVKPAGATTAGTRTPGSTAATSSGAGSASSGAAAGGSARPDVKIVAVEAEGAGRLYVSGSASPGATLRLYLNDAFVAPGSVSADGRMAFAIEKGIKPGDYRVRLDEVDPVTGAVRSRVEVPFNVPPVLADATAPGAARPGIAAGPGPGPGTPTVSSSAPQRAAAVETGPPAAGESATARARGSAAGTIADALGTTAPPAAIARADATVVVPSVDTARIVRGDNLWSISKKTYGSGFRYTVIFGANQNQIRDPKLIYPGQVFVLPRGETTSGG